MAPGGSQPEGDSAGRDERVAHTLTHLRDRLLEPLFPLRVPGADDARRICREVAAQVDDYVLPRLNRPDAPLLAVVGGSTGSGKSTLVNSLANRSVSPTGVLRPTTRSPVLICGEGDESWFTGDRVLPSLPRSFGEPKGGDEGMLHLVRCDTLPQGLAVIDSPDFDSVVAPNRDLAVQLLGASDLWLFVTTAARYADAVPWSFLLEARDRGVAVAVVVDRCTEESRQEASEHFAQLLESRGLGDVPFFLVPEVAGTGDTLPDDAVAPLRDWLEHIAADDDTRSALARETLDGVLASFSERLIPAIRVGEQQDEVVERLRGVVVEAYDDAREAVDNATVDGSLVKGDVLARWRELVGKGELTRSVGDGDAADPELVSALGESIASSVQAMIVAHAERAVEQVVARWETESAGLALLDEPAATLRDVPPGLPGRVRDAVTAWIDRTTQLVHTALPNGGLSERQYDARLLALILVLVTATPVGASASTDVAMARSATRASRKLLEALFGGEYVRHHAASVRRDLQGETHAVLESEAARYTELLEDPNVPRNCADRVREVLFALDGARQDAQPADAE